MLPQSDYDQKTFTSLRVNKDTTKNIFFKCLYGSPDFIEQLHCLSSVIVASSWSSRTASPITSLFHWSTQRNFSMSEALSQQQHTPCLLFFQYALWRKVQTNQHSSYDGWVLNWKHAFVVVCLLKSLSIFFTERLLYSHEWFIHIYTQTSDINGDDCKKPTVLNSPNQNVMWILSLFTNTKTKRWFLWVRVSCSGRHDLYNSLLECVYTPFVGSKWGYPLTFVVRGLQHLAGKSQQSWSGLAVDLNQKATLAFSAGRSTLMETLKVIVQEKLWGRLSLFEKDEKKQIWGIIFTMVQ